MMSYRKYIAGMAGMGCPNPHISQRKLTIPFLERYFKDNEIAYNCNETKVEFKVALYFQIIYYLITKIYNLLMLILI